MKTSVHSRTILAGLVLAGLVAAGAALGQETGDIHIGTAQQNHSEFFQLFNRYWWLLFPLFWGVGAILRNIFRHHRATEALTLVKAYADQGKEPPPELLAVLRQPDNGSRLNGGNFGTYGWIPVFLFGALTCGFVMFGFWPPDGNVPRPAMFMVALIMAGLCIGNLVALMARRKQDQVPPQ